MIVTIIGAGNAGLAHTCKLVEVGHRVRLVKTSAVMHTESFLRILKTGRVECIDDTAGGRRFDVTPDLATYDMAEGVRGAELVFIMTQSLQQEEVARRLGPCLEDGQMVVVIPGNMGSLYFRKHCRAANVLFAEGESTPFDARIVSPGVVNVLFKNVRNALSFFPASQQAEGIRTAGRLLDTYRYCRKNIVETALHNPNLVVHTVGCIMSAARIEMMRGEFWMYRESFSPSVWRLVSRLDKEKNDVLEAFGCDRIAYLDACKFRNEDDLSIDALEVFNSYARCGGPKGPASLDSRYIHEDVPMGLCLLSSLGKKFDIPTPLTDSLVNVASFLTGKDFWAHGRSLARLGLAHLERKELIEYLNA